MILRDIIFGKFFSRKDQLNDSNKDSNGKGINQRYHEMFADDIDDNMIPKIIDLLNNVVLPSYCDEDYLKLIENSDGHELFMANSTSIRRNVARQIMRYYEIKGSIRAYKIMLSLIGFNVAITEDFGSSGFDSTVTFDDPNRRFDSGCAGCGMYNLVLTRISGGTEDISSEELAAIESIILFNEPVNAKLINATYNGDTLGTIVTPAGDFNSDYSHDYN